ncbi:unnamed protein product [Ixodes persulcatus]
MSPVSHLFLTCRDVYHTLPFFKLPFMLLSGKLLFFLCFPSQNKKFEMDLNSTRTTSCGLGLFHLGHRLAVPKVLSWSCKLARVLLETSQSLLSLLFDRRPKRFRGEPPGVF